MNSQDELKKFIGRLIILDRGNSNESISQLRLLGRTKDFCKLFDADTFNLLISVLVRNLEDEPDLQLSLLATLSNILLSNENAALLVSKNEDLGSVIENNVFGLIRLLSLNDSILPAFRFIYLVSVNSGDNLQLDFEKYLEICYDNARLILSKFIVGEDILLVEILKIIHYLINKDKELKKFFFQKDSTFYLNYIKSNDTISTNVLLAISNIISDFEIEDNLDHSNSYLSFFNKKVVEKYCNLLQESLIAQNLSNVLSILNCINSFTELLQNVLAIRQTPNLLVNLETFFVPKDGSVPKLYISLMDLLLQNYRQKNPAAMLSLSSCSPTLISYLILDLYYKFCGNDVGKFLDELGILLTMDFLRIKQSDTVNIADKGFNNDEMKWQKRQNEATLYPRHYDILKKKNLKICLS
ncbi:hypothetical protein PACTADRAFT_4863 [Pachysolen tannophilus NRRL Y-2460]|uniref:Uncharacterized protein n=1 Tax=Pachysolen tannophilus NRRL Y-2460 TaxID=669874 RepID=A0A1E4TQE4_PACTA|nr:hypothetical protein PACTADRAFT_4863 [Pachysolen tannophilus NRRL Y-2460]